MDFLLIISELFTACLFSSCGVHTSHSLCTVQMQTEVPCISSRVVGNSDTVLTLQLLNQPNFSIRLGSGGSDASLCLRQVAAGKLPALSRIHASSALSSRCWFPTQPLLVSGGCPLITSPRRPSSLISGHFVQTFLALDF